MEYIRVIRLLKSTIVVLTIVFGVLSNQGLASDSLLGTWRCRSGSEVVSLEFRSENLLVFDGEAMRYTLVPGTIRVQEDYGLQDYRYFRRGNSLSIRFPDGSNLICAQATTQGEQPAKSRKGSESSKKAQSSPETSATTPGEVGDASWGFNFKPPKGWKFRKDHNGAILGHDTIAGMILVFPHNMRNRQQLVEQMKEGLFEEGVSLNLSSKLRRRGSDSLFGGYAGTVQGQRAKGHGIGTLSPHGGGAYILAVTTPERFGKEITVAAEAIANGIRYFKVDNSDLVRHFAGYWWYYSGTSAISHEGIIYLAPDGSYRDRREDSADVSNLNQYGDVTSQYLGNSQGRTRGRWTVRGTKSEGVISVTRTDGSSFDIDYKVKRSRNQKFGEYYFNGKIYRWVTEKQLRAMGY
jgi:hypothetical protein